MKIVIITQDAPMYLASFLDDFFTLVKQANHFIEGILVLSPVFKKNFYEEFKSRYEYYGLIDFLRLVWRIMRNKFFSLIFYVYPLTDCYSVGNVLKRHNIKSINVNLVNSERFIKFVKSNQVDLIISIAAPQIFKQEILNIPKKGCVNYHTALLPKHRGRQPLFWALLDDDECVGVTIHEMDNKLDNGPIIAQEKIVVDPKDTLHSLYLKTIKIGPKVLVRAINILDNDISKRIDNNFDEATYNSFPDKQAVINFRAKRKRFF